jgi:hypothetical protein
MRIKRQLAPTKTNTPLTELPLQISSDLGTTPNHATDTTQTMNIMSWRYILRCLREMLVRLMGSMDDG